ncbi:MAG: FRG domain-containing protein [Woeseia sp.]
MYTFALAMPRICGKPPIDNGGAMTIKDIRVKSLQEALQELGRLATHSEDFVFRGHSNPEWKICSTLQRYTAIPHQSWDNTLDDMLLHFMVNLRTIGQLPEEIARDRRARLESGRHYGVPSPLIDFSLSPYVALFFAFNGVRPDRHKPDAHVVVYALDIGALGVAWARLGGKFDQNEYESFMRERESLFKDGYPGGMLKYIRFPASWNTRMQRQKGVFIYDTLNYALLGCENFEEFVGQQQEPLGPSSERAPILTKIFIPASEAGDAFSLLEMMAVSATQLYDSHEGAVADVVNSYNYNRKMGYAWDLALPPPDDTKM